MHIPSRTLVYLAMILGLLVVPRALQRFRLPAPLTCFIFGIVGAVLFKTTIDGQVLRVIATLGVASLFLLAGLEVDVVEISPPAPAPDGPSCHPRNISDCHGMVGHSLSAYVMAASFAVRSRLLHSIHRFHPLIHCLGLD